jgi:hypothetical protein
MINISEASGPVRVEDGRQSIQAESGMTINNYGEKCVIATGDGGRATFSFNGHQIKLSPNQYFRVRPLGSRVFGFMPRSREMKIALGRLWSHIFEAVGGREDRDWIEGANDAPGVRG